MNIFITKNNLFHTFAFTFTFTFAFSYIIFIFDSFTNFLFLTFGLILEPKVLRIYL